MWTESWGKKGSIEWQKVKEIKVGIKINNWKVNKNVAHCLQSNIIHVGCAGASNATSKFRAWMHEAQAWHKAPYRSCDSRRASWVQRRGWSRSLQLQSAPPRPSLPSGRREEARGWCCRRNLSWPDGKHDYGVYLWDGLEWRCWKRAECRAVTRFAVGVAHVVWSPFGVVMRVGCGRVDSNVLGPVHLKKKKNEFQVTFWFYEAWLHITVINALHLDSTSPAPLQCSNALYNGPTFTHSHTHSHTNG